MRSVSLTAALPLLLVAPLWGVDNTIVEYAAPSGTPTASPPAPYPDAQFAYQYFVPKVGDPNQRNLYYRLYTPPSYSTSGSAKHPLVFFLHGDGEKENSTIRNQLQMRDNGQYAFCSAGSQALLPCFYALVQTSWYGRDGGAQTAADLTAALAAKYRIDPDRVFVTGLSGGGGATLAWAGKQPGNWAGYVPLSAPSPGDVGSYQPANLATIPSWFFAAKDDTTVGSANQDGQMTDLRKNGGRPIYTCYDTGGHSKTTWGAAYNTKALVAWMAGLRRGQPAVPPVDVTITAPTSAPTWNSTATSTNLQGTTVDRQLDGASAGLTSVAWFTPSSATQTAGGTLANWTSTANLPLPAGDTYVVATATGSSFTTARGGKTTYCDVLQVRRTVAVNAAPSALASADQSITLPAAATLSGSISDDGLPAGSTLSAAWSLVSGPGSVVFAASTSAATSATFSTAGTYTLRLTVSDGSLSGSDDVVITVNPAVPVNAAPVVNAGVDQNITLPASVSLVGTTTDDGLPQGSTISSAWSLVSGPGTVTFANPASTTTTATFSTVGTYLLRLTASDGSLSSSDTLNVTVAAGTARVLIDLGSDAPDTTGNGGLTTGNWNNLYGNTTHLKVANCIDDTGAATGISATAAGFANWPVSTNGIASAAKFPTTAQSDFMFLSSGTATVTLTGLDPASTYDVELFASRKWSTANSAYTVGGVTKTLVCLNNTATTVNFTGLTTSGSLVITVAPASGSPEGLLGVVALTRHITTTPAVALKAVAAEANNAVDDGGSCGVGGTGIAMFGLALSLLRLRRPASRV